MIDWGNWPWALLDGSIVALGACIGAFLGTVWNRRGRRR